MAACPSRKLLGDGRVVHCELDGPHPAERHKHYDERDRVLRVWSGIFEDEPDRVSP